MTTITFTQITTAGKDAGVEVSKTLRREPGGFVKQSDYPPIKYWTRQVIEIKSDIDAVHAAVCNVSQQADSCIVLGLPTGAVPDDKPAQRLKHARTNQAATIREHETPLLVLDIDKCPIPEPLTVNNVVEAVDYVRSLCGLADVSIAWQLTGSAACLIGKPLLSVRLFAVTDRPISNVQRKQYARAINQQAGFKLADPAIYQAAQPVYTAPARLLTGTDPFRERSGVLYGEQDVMTWPDEIRVTESVTGSYSGRFGAPVRSFAEAVARIGDGDGQHGIHGPTFFCVGIGTRHGLSVDDMHEQIRRHVLSTDTSKHDQAYTLRETSQREIQRIADWWQQTRQGENLLLPERKKHDRPAAIPLQQAEQQIEQHIQTWLDNPAATVLSVTVGAGKTHQAVQAALAHLEQNPDAKILWFAPTHNQAIEVETAFNSANSGNLAFLNPTAIRIRGRDQADEGETPLCHRPQVIQLVRDKGLAAHTMSLCCEYREKGEVISACPYRRECGYFAQFESNVRVRILPHQMMAKPQARALSDEWARGVTHVVVDESPVNVLLHHHRHKMDALEEDLAGVIAQTARRIFDGEVFEPDVAAKLAEGIDEVAQELAQIAPDLVPGQSSEYLAERLSEFKPNPRAKYQRFALCLAEYLRGAHNAVWRGKDGYLHFAWRNQPDVLQQALILDATAQDDIYAAILPDVQIHRIEVKQNLKIVQINDSAISKNRIEGDAELPHRIAGLCRLTNAAFIGNLSLEETVKLLLPDNAMTGHFNALRGINAMQDADTLVIAGRPEPDALAAEAMARALWPTDDLNLPGKFEWQRDSDTGAGIAGHIDPRVDAVLCSIREAEIAQAIGRLRAVRSDTTKTVYLLTTAPAARPPDVVCTLDDLLPSYRWSRAINDSNGVILLGDKWLHGRLPDVFETQTEAKRWIDRERDKGTVLLKESLSISETVPLQPIQFRVAGQAGSMAKGITWLPDESAIRHAIEQATGRTVTALKLPEQEQQQMSSMSAPKLVWETPSFAIHPYAIEQAPPPKWETPSYRIVETPVEFTEQELEFLPDAPLAALDKICLFARMMKPDEPARLFVLYSMSQGFDVADVSALAPPPKHRQQHRRLAA